MKGFQYAILLGAGICLGFGIQSVMGITMRKSANSRFLSESQLTLKIVRGAVAAFKGREGRFPRGAAELFVKGDLNPSDPPVEIWHKSGRWAGSWDGEGGFLYSSATGQVLINSDVSREKFFRADWKRVLDGDVFPKGKIF